MRQFLLCLMMILLALATSLNTWAGERHYTFENDNSVTCCELLKIKITKVAENSWLQLFETNISACVRKYLDVVLKMCSMVKHFHDHTFHHKKLKKYLRTN